MCKLFKNIILFCDEECAEYIRQKEFDNVRIVVMNFNSLDKISDMERYEKAFTRMRKHLAFNRKIHLPFKRRHTSCIVNDVASIKELSKFTVLYCSKIDLMVKAYSMNPYGTDYFYWLDGGCVQDKYSQLWREWDGTIMHKPQGFRCALDMARWSMFHVKFMWTMYNIAYCFPPGNQIAAGFMGCRGSLLPIIKDEFDLTITKFLQRGLMSSEQSILTYMIKKRMDLFDIPVTLRGYANMVNDVANADALMMKKRKNQGDV